MPINLTTALDPVATCSRGWRAGIWTGDRGVPVGLPAIAFRPG